MTDLSSANVDMSNSQRQEFYENFWADGEYQLRYAFCSATLDRFPAIEKVWGSLVKPARVLDFGCGNGVLSYWLYANGFGTSVLGIDLSQTGVRNANFHFGRENLSFLETSKFDWTDNSFDVVVSSHVLEHIEAPQEVMAQLSSLAEWFVVEVPLESCLWVSLAAAIRGKSRKDNPLGHVNFWDRRSFNAFLADCGYLVVRDYQYASAPFFPANGRMKRWIERILLKILGVRLYGRLLATHYIVLARKNPLDRRRA